MKHETNVEQSSLYVDLAAGSQLHLRRIRGAQGGPALLLVHGAVANARTFYSERGKGLGPWLAQRGYDVFVLDLRGRGMSRPRIGRGARHGQTESIVEDLPAALREIERLRGEGIKIGLVAHSWGGVLLSSMLARHPAWAARIGACVYFGSKRSIAVWNWRRVLEIDLFWRRLASGVAIVAGYLPAAALRVGADNETRKSLRQSQQWVKPSLWRDSDDGFDYAAALSSGGLPPTLYLVGGNDPVRGHPDDVARFVAESGPHISEQVPLARSAGLRRDYGHVDMLTHPWAEDEIFPRVAHWLGRYLQSPSLSTD
jgi:pimeloyl-ACP methyl ester carboxylesterase